MSRLFGGSLMETEEPSNQNFRLHSQDDHEIYLFLEGDASYIVDGKTYTLQPNDVMVIRKHEMHRVFHNSSKRYRRVVINIDPAFFVENGCEAYETQFLKTELGNKLEASAVVAGGLFEAFRRLLQYTDNLASIDTPIAKGMIIEILYLLNQARSFAKADVTDKSMQRVIDYLNEHYTENVTLERLSEVGYLSVYYLCRRFRSTTGMTVHQYITKKRLGLARELVKTKSIGEAASLAGFNSYTSFYRAYRREYGVAPNQSL